MSHTSELKFVVEIVFLINLTKHLLQKKFILELRQTWPHIGQHSANNKVQEVSHTFQVSCLYVTYRRFQLFPPKINVLGTFPAISVLKKYSFVMSWCPVEILPLGTETGFEIPASKQSCCVKVKKSATERVNMSAKCFAQASTKSKSTAHYENCTRPKFLATKLQQTNHLEAFWNKFC